MLVVHTRKKHIPKRNSQRHQPITGVETRTNSHRNKTNRILWLKTTTPWTKLIIFRNRQHVLLIQRHRQHVRSTYPHILEMLHNLASLHHFSFWVKSLNLSCSLVFTTFTLPSPGKCTSSMLSSLSNFSISPTVGLKANTAGIKYPTGRPLFVIRKTSWKY